MHTTISQYIEFKYKILTSEYLADTVLRTWKERLFSWPWRPWKKTKKVPFNEVFLWNGDTIICHPSMEQGIITLLEEGLE